jgi:hypothetical protein
VSSVPPSLSSRMFAPPCHPGISRSEISGIQGPQTRAQPGAPGSRLCAPALSRACFGRDDKRRHVKPAAHTGRRGNTLGVTRTFAPPCHPGISRSEISGIQGPQTRAQPRGPRDAQTARRPRHAPSPRLLDPGSAQSRCRALASAGMTGARPGLWVPALRGHTQPLRSWMVGTRPTKTKDGPSHARFPRLFWSFPALCLDEPRAHMVPDPHPARSIGGGA